MSEFSINVVDSSMNIVVLSGQNDDPYQWIGNDYNFVSKNIPDVSVIITQEYDKMHYEYTIKNIDDKSICVNDESDNSSGLIKIPEFINTIEEYDDIEIIESNGGQYRALMNIGDKKVEIQINRVMGYKCAKFIFKIIM